MRADAFHDAQARTLEVNRVDAEHRWVDTPVVEGRAHVLVSGDGPPVVLVNGIGTPAAMWAPLMARLDGYRLYGVDLPSYGLTDHTDTLADDLRPNAVRFLEQVLDGLALERTAVVANSLGSLWAMWLALARPERVAALVHIGCPAVVLDTSAPMPMRLLAVRPLGRLLMGLQPPSPRQVARLAAMVREHPLEPEIADLLLATERLPGFERTFLATLNRLLRLRGNRPELALDETQLARVGQPSQLIFGAEDPMGDARVAERVAEALPDAEFHTVEGGHVPWLHNADSVGRLVARFLETRYAAPWT